MIKVVRCHTGYRILMPTPDPEFLHLRLVRLLCAQSGVDMVESGMILPTGWLSRGVISLCVVAVNLVAGSVASFKKNIFPINFGQFYPFFYRLTVCNWSSLYDYVFRTFFLRAYVINRLMSNWHAVPFVPGTTKFELHLTCS